MIASRKPVGVDLFCGAGGMSLGFEQAGFNVVAGFDSEPRHIATYQSNFPSSKAFTVDLATASGKHLRNLAALGSGPIDALFGGPPCQGFSLGGRRDLADPRNQQILHFARLVSELRPRYFVVENVEGLLLGHARSVVASFREQLRPGNYSVVEPIGVLDASNFGVPQRRRRTFILGYRHKLPAPCYPEPAGVLDGDGRQRFPTVWDAIGDLPRIEGYPDLYEKDGFWGRLGAPSYYACLLRVDTAGTSGRFEGDSLAAHPLTGCLRTRHSQLTVRRFRQTQPGSSEAVSRFHRLDPNGVAPTIRAGTGSDRGSHTAPRPIHPYEPRCITVREAARLHSFPDWFRFDATRWHAFRQIGNSVPPLLARAVAASILKTYSL